MPSPLFQTSMTDCRWLIDSWALSATLDNKLVKYYISLQDLRNRKVFPYSQQWYYCIVIKYISQLRLTICLYLVQASKWAVRLSPSDPLQHMLAMDGKRTARRRISRAIWKTTTSMIITYLAPSTPPSICEEVRAGTSRPTNHRSSCFRGKIPHTFLLKMLSSNHLINYDSKTQTCWLKRFKTPGEGF